MGPGYNQRVLVRLDESVPLTVEQVDAALAVGASFKFTYRSVGAERVRAELEKLAAGGLAREVDGGWVLTDKGGIEWNRLETLFDNSNGYGDYGF